MLTIVLSKPSRFDKANNKLLCGPAESLARSLLSKYNFKLEDCLITTVDKFRHTPGSPILFTGVDCLEIFRQQTDLNAHRGYVYTLGGKTPCVHTYAFQDAADRKDYESTSFDPEEDEGGDSSNSKDSAQTSRSNYRFYVERDIDKLLNYVPAGKQQSTLCMAGPAEIQELSSYRGGHLYLDIETHPSTNTLQCLSWAHNSGRVVTQWIYNHRGELNPAAVSLMAALARAMAHTCVVVHNGSGFDLPFLAAFHGIPFGRRIYDTMLAGHRIFPEAEKSLAHAISIYANRPYHKDSAGTFYPKSWDQLNKLMLYNMLDVDAMRDVHLGQLKFINRDPAVQASVEQVNASAYTYALVSLTGFNVDIKRRDEIIKRNEQTLAGYQRVLNTLVGQPFNPNSSKQCVQYFHEGMKYPVLERSDKTGEPSIGGDVLYRFRLNYPNPVIDVILAMREISKSTSQLKFNLFTRLKSR